MRLAGLGHLAPAVAASLLTASLVYGCSVTLSPMPSPILSQVDCGPLAADDCAAAVEVAKARLATGVVLTSIRVASPTPDHTCPPSGGLRDSHACAVIVVISTGDGNLDIGLLRTTSGGWIDGVNIR